MSHKRVSVTLLGFAALAACSGTATIPTTGGGQGSATLSVINALRAGSGVTVTLDQAAVGLPAVGQRSQLAISAGTHELKLSSASGRTFGTLSFSVDRDSTRTVVVSGTVDTAIVSVAVDSNRNAPSDTVAGVPITGHILLVNSAPNVGPFDVYVYRANSDSTLHFGSFSFGAGTSASTSPYRFLFPFDPGTYTFDVTNPGSTTTLASVVVSLATNDQWTVMLTKETDGTLTLTATKQ